MPLSPAERQALLQGYASVQEQVETLVRNAQGELVAQAGAAYGKDLPAAVHDQILAAAAKGQGFEAIQRAITAQFRAQSGKLEAATPALTELITPTVEAETFGGKPTAADVAAAQKAWKAGDSDEDIKAAVAREIAARPWTAHPVAMRLAPKGMSQAEQYQYYLKLANTITPIAKLPQGHPVILLIRGLSESGQVHSPYGMEYGYQDVMVVLNQGQVKLFAADSNPQQVSTSASEQAQGWVGALEAQRAYYGSVDGPFNGGSESWRLHMMNADGQPINGQTVPLTYNKNKDGTLQDDYQAERARGQSSNGTGTAVKLHSGPYSVACVTEMDGFNTQLAPILRTPGYLILGEANPVG